MAIPISGFTRLKSLFKGSINLSNYDDILKKALNAEIGSLPKDMLGKILSGTKTASPVDQILLAKKGLADALVPLNHGMEITQRAQSISLQKIFSKFITKERIISLDFFDDINFANLTGSASPKVIGVKDASLELTKVFSQIFPDCSKVNVSALNSGSFGMGFKLEFLDSTGNKVLHDKVLKLFYKEGMTGFDIIEKNASIILKKFKDLTTNMTKRDVVTLFNNLKNKINSLSEEEIFALIKRHEAELAKNNITITPEQVKDVLTKVKDLKLKDIKPLLELLNSKKQGSIDFKTIFEMMKGQMFSHHGAIAEANTSSFLRNRLGHSLSKTDVIIPDYYDLKRGYAIAEYSDDLLPKPTSKVNFSSLGLIHSDLHEGNKVAGRIVDVGGILVDDIRLQDKITLRVFKKITNQKNLQCREEYIKRLREEMANMNFLDRAKVQQAIEIAELKLAS